MAKIRIMLADDHTLFRQGIRTLISAEADMEVVGEASNGGDAVDKANEARPDVVLMDIGMPGLSSFEATRQIKKNRPETKVLFLTMYDDEDYLVEGMEVGASGYVLKDSPASNWWQRSATFAAAAATLARACYPNWWTISVAASNRPTACRVSPLSLPASGKCSRCWRKAIR